jgi:hypothetical protein
MVASGLTITRAIRSSPWPASSASLEYAAVWGTPAAVVNGGLIVCDGVEVGRISSLLEEGGRTSGLPRKLRENLGIAFIGVNMNGTGFELPPEVASAMISRDPRNADVLFPVLGGEDINGIPSLAAPMWAVDFYQLEAEQARSYDEPFAWVEQNVKPHRASLTQKPKLIERWWRYERDAIAMREATIGLGQLLAIAITSKSLMPVRVRGSQLFTHAVTVFASASFAEQAILSSSLHQLWAIKYGSGMRTDPRYVPSDVFETFPRPNLSESLNAVGRLLDEERREIMLRRDLGLTTVYNLVNDLRVTDAADPDVARLRRIHVELDEVVMDAYGWSDIPLNHGFHTYRQMERWTVSPAARVEILDRLLEENHRRAAAEGAAGKSAGKGRKARNGSDGTEFLFR